MEKLIKTSASQLKAQKKYDSANVKKYGIKLNCNTDADIINKLSEVDNVQGYIKSLIRQDIEDNG